MWLTEPNKSKMTTTHRLWGWYVLTTWLKTTEKKSPYLLGLKNVYSVIRGTIFLRILCGEKSRESQQTRRTRHQWFSTHVLSLRCNKSDATVTTLDVKSHNTRRERSKTSTRRTNLSFSMGSPHCRPKKLYTLKVTLWICQNLRFFLSSKHSLLNLI